MAEAGLIRRFREGSWVFFRLADSGAEASQLTREVEPPTRILPPEDEEQLARNIELTLAGQAPARGFEQRVMRKNGLRMDVRLYISPPPCPPSSTW